MTYNRGIDHLAHRAGGRPLCNKRNAIMSSAIATVDANPDNYVVCKRCAAKLAKMREVSARRAAKA